MENLFTYLFNAIFGLFIWVINLILTPIDTLISSLIPSYVTISANVSSFLNYFLDYFRFVLGWVNIPSEAVALISGYITFRVVLFFGSLTYRLFIRWYSALKS